jgi:SET domain-containing protein
MKVASYRSEKTKVLASSVHGKGLFAVRKIKKGEVIAIKGGHIIDRKTYKSNRELIGQAECQITDNFFLAPFTKSEYKDVMIYFNHSCEPNTGLMGNIVFIAIKDIAKNTEVTLDYAFYKDDGKYQINCSCNTKSCRKIVTGKDWKRKDIQKKYKEYFSSYLQRKIAQPHWSFFFIRKYVNLRLLRLGSL